MKKGQILFVKGDSFISKIINKLDGEYSHVCIAVSDTSILEAQRFSESRIVKNYHENYDVIELELDEYQKEILAETAIELIGYDYDYKQISFTLFNQLFKVARMNDRNKFICSEIVVNLLYKLEIIDEDEYGKLIDCTPNELYRYLV